MLDRRETLLLSNTSTKFGHCPTSQRFFKLVKFHFGTLTPQNILKLLFTQSKRSTSASTNSFFKKKDGCRFCVNKPIFLSQWEAFLPWGLFDKTTLRIVPKNGLLICTSRLQVSCHYLQVKFTSAFAIYVQVLFASVLISVLCLTVIPTAKF